MSHGCLGILQERLLPGEILQPPYPNGWDRPCCVYTWFIHHSFLLLTFYIGHGFVRMSWLSRHCLCFHVRLWQQSFFCNFLSLNSTANLLLYLQSITTIVVKSIAPCTCLSVSEFWLDEWSSVPINLNVILFFTRTDEKFCSLQRNNSYAFGSSLPVWMESQHNTFKCTPKGWERFGKLNAGLLFVSTKQSPKSHLT